MIHFLKQIILFLKHGHQYYSYFFQAVEEVGVVGVRGQVVLEHAMEVLNIAKEFVLVVLTVLE